MITPQAALALDRWCFDGAAIAAYGCSGFIGWAAPPPLCQSLAASSRRWLIAAGLLALVATLAWLPLEAATSSEDWHAAIDGSMLSALLFDTAIGKAWLARSVLALLLLAVLLWRPAGRWSLLAATTLLASLALSGHARIDSGWLGALHGLNDVVHLLSGGAWLGALLMLPPCLARLRDPRLGADARLALRRFSSAGHLAVALVIATGIVNALLILRSWPTGSLYQWLLAAKIVLVLAMVALALLNRYVFVPHMRAAPERAIARLRRGTLAELALGCGVLALVASFGLLDPA